MPHRTPYERWLLETTAQCLPGCNPGNIAFRDNLNFLAREWKGFRIWNVSGNKQVY